MRKSLITLTSIILLSLPNFAFAQNTQTFGQRGNHGRDGYNGRSGRNGQNRDIFVDDTIQTYDLSGENGEDGTDGEYGTNASNCRQPQRPTHNLQGANGGDGGDGGDGGNGGDGGDLTIYYNDASELKRIIVDNSGGKGGRNGRGAEGGEGCPVYEKYWQVKYCRWELWFIEKNVPDSQWQRSRRKKVTRCTGVEYIDAQKHVPRFPRRDKNKAWQWKYLGVTKTHSYRAKEGYQGKSGSDGKRGQNGVYGEVTLIPRKEIPTEKVSYQDSFVNLMGKQVDLVKNIWVEKSGLRSLLNAASNVPDTYAYLLLTANLGYRIDWQTQKTLQELEMENIKLGGKIIVKKLQPEMSLDLSNIPGTIDYQVKTEDNLTTLTITGGFAPSRVKSFRLDEFTEEKPYELIFVDEGKVRELVKNTKITVETFKGNDSGNYSFRDKVTFEIPPDKLPKGSMNFNEDKYTLNLGRNLFSWLSSGAKVKYKVTISQVTKSGTVYNQPIEIDFVIP